MVLVLHPTSFKDINMIIKIDNTKIKSIIPNTVTMRQARLALLQSGYLEQVNTIIASMSGIEGETARIEWEYAQEVSRDSSLVSNIALAIPLTDSQIDDLFILANSL